MKKKHMITAVLTAALIWSLWGTLPEPGFALTATDDYLALSTTEETADEVDEAVNEGEQEVEEEENTPEIYDEEDADKNEPEEQEESDPEMSGDEE